MVVSQLCAFSCVIFLCSQCSHIIDSIAGQMNSALSPRTVLYFTKLNDSGAQFPPASPTAYSHINAEFPNSVVQSYDGNALSQSDLLLYNNNYNRIKTMF